MKKQCSLFSIILCFTILTASYNYAKDKGLYGVSMVKNVTFVTRDGEPIQGDLYQPADAQGKLAKGPHPAFVLVHGGGFVMGSKDIQFKDAGKWLTERGYVCFNVNYRLRKKGNFPNDVNDVKCGVKFLRANATKFGVDPERIGVMGGSAGGYLTAFAGVTQDHPDFKPACGEYDKESDTVQAAVPVYGGYDFQAILSDKMPEAGLEMLEHFVGEDMIQEVQNRFKKASVMPYIKKMSTRWLILHGSADDLVPISQATILQEALTKAGVDSELAIIDKGKHGFMDVAAVDLPAYNKAIEVFEKWLKKKFPAK